MNYYLCLPLRSNDILCRKEFSEHVILEHFSEKLLDWSSFFTRMFDNRHFKGHMNSVYLQKIICLQLRSNDAYSF